MNTVFNRAGSRFVTVYVQSAVAPIEDWDSTVLFTGGMKIAAIEMVPTAEGDIVRISDGQALLSGFLFNHVALGAYDIAVRSYAQHDKFGHKGVLCTPRILIANCVGNFFITFELA